MEVEGGELFIYFQANLRSEIGWKFYFRPNLVKRVVYEGKFKLFDLSVARVKKFEFARVNHEFDQIRSEIQFPTVFRPQICPNVVLCPILLLKLARQNLGT